MGSEGRSWNGAAVAVAGGGGGEEKMSTVPAPPAEVPTSAAAVDIALPLPEMAPRVMQVP
jgi:ethanolamine kinase